KARIKFLIQKIGIDAFNELVEAEQTALTNQHYKIDVSQFDNYSLPSYSLPVGKKDPDSYREKNPVKFETWRNTNVYRQKQDGFVAVYLRVLNGNINSETSRRL